MIRNKAIRTAAHAIRCHTSTAESSSMSRPNTPVNPAMNTDRCRSRKPLLSFWCKLERILVISTFICIGISRWGFLLLILSRPVCNKRFLRSLRWTFVSIFRSLSPLSDYFPAKIMIFSNTFYKLTFSEICQINKNFCFLPKNFYFCICIWAKTKSIVKLI